MNQPHESTFQADLLPALERSASRPIHSWPAGLRFSQSHAAEGRRSEVARLGQSAEIRLSVNQKCLVIATRNTKRHKENTPRQHTSLPRVLLVTFGVSCGQTLRSKTFVAQRSPLRRAGVSSFSRTVCPICTSSPRTIAASHRVATFAQSELIERLIRIRPANCQQFSSPACPASINL